MSARLANRAGLVVAVVLRAALAPDPSSAATPLGTGFTYQGRLTESGSPASGVYDLRFILFDVDAGGAQVGPIVTLEDVTVASGLFTVSLDFGASAFAGEARWLEVGARPGTSTGAFTTLSPRQELKPSPNAVFSAKVPWTGISGMPTGFADGVDNDSGGTITGVTAGAGLSGGGTSGPVSLAVDTAAVQSRVAGTCAAGSSIRTVNPDGSVVCQADTTGSDWGLTGNAGTSPVTNFIGTTDNVPLELRVSNQRALRLERVTSTVGESTYAGQNALGGDAGNSITAGVTMATVGGGGGMASGGYSFNRVTDIAGTVAGGYDNEAGDGAGALDDSAGATVGGGTHNRASGLLSVVAGGSSNTASRFAATVGGGAGNTAYERTATVGGGEGNLAYGGWSTVAGGSGNWATGGNAFVGGGRLNVASGNFAAVAGGYANTAGGDASLAAGQRAKVRNATQSNDTDGDEGTFVWADSTALDFQSTGPNQFLVRANGGVGINTNSPLAALQILGPNTNEGTALFAPDPSKGSFNSHVHYGANGDWYIRSANANGNVVLQDTGGNVGVGTAGPTARLHAVNATAGGTGVYGVASATTGFSVGVRGESASSAGIAVWGHSTPTAASGFPIGVEGRSDSPTGVGVNGFAAATSGVNYGVRGATNSPSGWAGYFLGNVQVTGTLTKGGGSFKIDHPLDPENRYLYHSFVESPDMKDIYDGVVTTDEKGFATVGLPEWFEALNRDFRYQLTVIGDGDWSRARVFRKIEANCFTIQTDKPGVEVSWQVTGIRQDAFAEKHRIPVEEDKPEGERGRCLYPEACGGRD